jgi:branched-chain amino acid transport system permease protein
MAFLDGRRRVVSEPKPRNALIRFWPVWVLVAFAVIAPPFLGSYFHYIFALALINVIIAIGLNILTGNAGQISVCHSAFMAIGAYTTTYLYAKTGVPYLLALPAGAVLAGVCGLVLGFPALRVRGFYLAVVTLGFLELSQIIINETPDITGGVRGIASIRPTILGYKFSGDLSFYYLVLVITLASIWFGWSLMRSPTGRAFNAIRSSEAVAQTLSIPLARTKLVAFVLSAVYAGIGGGLYATSVGFIDPLEFSLLTSIRHVTFIVVGGVGSISGSVVGAIALTFLPEALRSFKEYNELVFGGLLLIVLIAFPKGLVGIWQSVQERWFPVSRLSARPLEAAKRGVE